MSGGRGKPKGRGGRNWNRRSNTSGRGNANKSTKNIGANKTLGTHVFDYGSKGVADQMITTWEQIVIHVGTIMGEDI